MSAKKAPVLSNRERYITIALYLVLIVAKFLRLPASLFPTKIQRIMQYWDVHMLWLYVRSLGTRVYMDQPCWLKVKHYEPRCIVEEKYRLTPEQIRKFYEDGFIGPLTAVSEEEMVGIREALVDEMNRESKAFGFKTVRDRHLDSPIIRDLFSRPAFTETLAQLLGPDLIVWRSQFFNQMPGAPPITWHQASTYMHEDYKRPILEPETKDELFQLTTWIALDEATFENGCLQFVRGSHDSIKAIKVGGDSGFYDAHFAMDYEIDPAKVVNMELKPGQFVIFSERTVHGSPGNRTTDKRRLGINFRTITPSTKVYHGQDAHYAVHLREKWDLKNWGVMVLRGEDHLHLNKEFKEFQPTL